MVEELVFFVVKIPSHPSAGLMLRPDKKKHSVNFPTLSNVRYRVRFLIEFLRGPILMIIFLHAGDPDIGYWRILFFYYNSMSYEVGGTV